MAQVGHSSSTINLLSNHANDSSNNNGTSTTKSAVGANSSSGSSIVCDDKSLKDKDFSEVMGRYSEAEKPAASTLKSSVSGAADGSVESPEEALGEGPSLLLQTPLDGLTITGTGKELPIEGSPLPPLGLLTKDINVPASPANTIIVAAGVEPSVITASVEQALTPGQTAGPGAVALAGGSEPPLEGTIAVTALGSAPAPAVVTNTPQLAAAEEAVLPTTGSAVPEGQPSAALGGAGAEVIATVANPVAVTKMASSQTLNSDGLTVQDLRGRLFDDGAAKGAGVLATTKISATDESITATTRAHAIAPPLALNAGGQMQMTAAVETLAALTSGVPSEAIATVAATGSGATVAPSLAVAETPSGYRQLATSPFQTAVPIEVGKPGWSDGVMQKVMWMSSQQINRAEIALDPPELGPLQVRVATQGDQTTVTFTSAHGSVRDALDQGVSRLREMMENQGLNLADVDVSDQRKFSSGDQNSQSQGDEADQEGNGDGDDAATAADNTTANGTTRMGVRLVDSYV